MDAIIEVPKERWDIDAVFDPDPHAMGKMYTRWGGFLRPRVDLFDADFFSIAPREAPSIDPQQRLFLEVCWEALERGCVAPDRLQNSLTGIFAGIFSHDYAEIMARNPAALNAYSNVGMSAGAIAGRVSYLLGSRGPSLTVDTASSSSLVAVHLACESLRAGSSDLALAGGVNLILTPTIGIGFCRAGAMSPDGRCRVFDASANGYVRGEGCGVVVLKRLSDARADGDPILAVIRGTAINQDGASNGLMAPSQDAQAALLGQVLANAGIEPARVSYLEAHGTGTQVGDLAEARAIASVYGGDRNRRSPLLIGSAKTNIGHLESAAGIAGLIKVILALQHREIPANLHFQTRNAALPLDEIPAVVPVELTPWDLGGPSRFAGVSSFGFSGTNAHVLLEEVPAPMQAEPRSGPRRPAHLLCLSAKSAPALIALAQRYEADLASHPDRSVADVCFSAGHGRAHFVERLAVVGRSSEEFRAKLAAVRTGDPPPGVIRGKPRQGAESPKIAFLFPGGGAQYPRMGHELYDTQPVFRTALDRCATALKQHLQEPLHAVLWGDCSALLDRMDYMQPALFSIEYALSELWRSWGIEPGAVIGHSLGEVVAATVAGVFSLQDGLMLISRRAALMHAAPEQGAMAAVAASEDHVRGVIGARWRRVSIGAVNGPESTMISGDRREVQQILDWFEQQGIKVKLLPISHASHSPLMEPILGAFEEAISEIRYARPAMPLISNLTGRRVVGDEVGRASYWRNHIRQAVRFAGGMTALAEEGCRAFVEVGPGATLLGMGQDCTPGDVSAVWCPSIRRDREEWDQILESLGTLYTRGVKVDWEGLSRDDPARKIALPTYPFQRQSYWVGALEGSPGPSRVGPGSPAPALEDPSLQASIAGSGGASGRRVQRILDETELRRRRELLGAFLEDELARALGRASMAGVDTSRPFRELGVDSFMSQLLRARLVEELGSHLADEVPRTVLFAHTNLALLTEFLLEKLAPAGEGVGSAHGRTAAPARQGRTDTPHEPIAIIGMACRFPGGADDLSSFWTILGDGVDAIGLVPSDRWDVDALYDPDPDAPGKLSTRWGGFLAGRVDAFDAAFFDISPREARDMDPQQRLFLETAWTALEHANQPPRALRGTRTGVYAGVFGHDYLSLQLADRAAVNAHTGTGSNESILAGRLSFHLGLEGPSMVVNTACSSSLVAIHLAVQSLRQSECDLALAGGVNLILTPEYTIAFSKARMMAPDGRCKTFDASANGYVRGEGSGVVVLKRLSDAIRGQDRILALIRGTAVNQDGASNGLTAPSPVAQEALIRQALSDAGIAPGEVQYLEAHGTGTPLGDPIEVQALGAVLKEGRAQDDPLYIGSVKTNIGHLESAAGVAGMIKVVLALEHEEIPPHLHLKKVNPLIQLDRIPARVPTQRVLWARGDRRRIAGVSSFGFSGTNAHVVLEEAPPNPTPGNADHRSGAPRMERLAHLLCLSARTDSALVALVGDYERAITASPALDLGDLCFSAGAGRSHFEKRLAMIGRTAAEMTEQLGAIRAGAPSPAIKGTRTIGGKPPSVAFLFTGQGSQYSGMGRELYHTQPTFRRVFDHCAEILAQHLPVPLTEVLWSDHPEKQALIDQTQYTQPALFALEYALYALWRSWGVAPAAVIGHSVGELVAAAVAGVFSLEDGLGLIARRASLMQALPMGGEMASIAASEQRVREAIAPYADALSIAAVNSPTSTVISGASVPLREVLGKLEAQGTRVKLLGVSHAFHSALMEPALDELESFASTLSYAKPSMTLVSNVTGRPFERDQVHTGRYWRHHARQAVRFADGLQALAQLGIRHFVELGPHPVLLAMGAETLPDIADGRWLPSLRRNSSDREQFLRSLGQLYVSGIDLDWRGGERDDARTMIALPTYPFQREHHWLPAPASNGAAPRGEDPILGHRIDLPNHTVVFESAYGVRTMPWLSDHRIYGPVVVPAAGQIARMLNIGRALHALRRAELAEIVFERPVVLRDDELRKVQVHVAPEADAGQRFEIFSLEQPDSAPSAPSAPAWIRNVSGQLRMSEPAQEGSRAPDERAIRRRCEELPIDDYLSAFRRAGVNLGQSFVWAEQAWVGQGEALVCLREPRPEEKQSALLLHPGLVDSFITTGVLVALRSNDDVGSGAFLPLMIESFAWLGEHAGPLSCHAMLRGEASSSRGSATLDIEVWDTAGQRIAQLRGLVLRHVPEDKILAGRRPDHRDRSILKPRSRLTERIERAAPPEREEILRQFLVAEIRQVLGFDGSREIDPNVLLSELGLDSFLAMQLQSQIMKEVGDSAEIPLTLAFDYPTMNALISYLAQSLALPGTAADVTATVESPVAASSVHTSLRSSAEEGTNEPIAIIGMACRFPGGANAPQSYWELLRHGRDAIVEVPRERWDLGAYFDKNPDAPGKMYSRWGGFLNEEVDTFDASFFKISADEARVMDPQQRLVLEVSWEALEDAGIAPVHVKGSSAGIFLGASAMDFSQLAADASTITSHGNSGKYLSVIAGRVSYVLGMQGPSFVVDTACSSSLVAIHQACQSLRSGESELALAGGVNLMLSPIPTIGFCKARMLSVDGPCKTFDASATGYSRGEGCGLIVLKRLSDAQRDGDRVLAVIRGSAVNNNGSSGRLTMPNGLAQRQVIRSALGAAGVSPVEVSVIEAHGTATSVGDAIEFQALAEVFRAGRAASEPLLITSVKTNIGHLEPAAGIAGVIKVVLALQMEEIPPHLHLTKVNPLIPLESIPAAIPLAPTPWKQRDKPRIAGVSAFAFQGTNAHVILAEAPVAADRPSRVPLAPAGHVFAFSARDERALRALAESHLRHFERGEPVDIFDACYTVNCGRAHFAYRIALTCGSRDEIVEKLRRFLEDGRSPGVFYGHAREDLSVGLRFEDSPSQHAGEWLFDTHPVYRAAIARVEATLQKHSRGDHSIDPWGKDRDTEVGELARVAAWLELWRSWGVIPEWVDGNGVAVARTGGSFDLDQAVRRALEHPVPPPASEDSRRGDLAKVDHVIVLGPATRGADLDDADLALLDAAGDWGQIHAALALLYVRGAAIDWAGLEVGHARRKIAMPTYPFQRTRVG